MIIYFIRCTETVDTIILVESFYLDVTGASLISYVSDSSTLSVAQCVKSFQCFCSKFCDLFSDYLLNAMYVLL